MDNLERTDPNTTITFHPDNRQPLKPVPQKNSRNLFPLLGGVGIFFIVIAAFFIGGAVDRFRMTWPLEGRNEALRKSLDISERKLADAESQLKLEREQNIKRIAELKTLYEIEILTTEQVVREKTAAMLTVCRGTLEVIDGEAQKVRYKRAVIVDDRDSKMLIDLEDHKSYKMLWYVYQPGKGTGFVQYDEVSHFKLVWKDGKIKAPTTIPGFIHIPAGIKVQVGPALENGKKSKK